MLFFLTFYSLEYIIYKTQHIVNKSEWFLKDNVTLKTGAMDYEKSTLHHMNKLHFTVYKIKNSYFEL